MIQYSSILTSCDKQTILQNGGQVIENSDGTVSVFINDNRNNLIPVEIGKTCCTTMGYTFDNDKQQCRWSQYSNQNNITFSDPNLFNIAINPNGNDGAMFVTEENETCILNIEFDYLIKVKCETLQNTFIKTGNQNTNCDSPVKFLENISISLTLNINNDNNTIYPVYTTSGTTNDLFPKIGVGNLYGFLNKKDNSGLFVCGGDDSTPLNLGLTGTQFTNETSCDSIVDSIVNELYRQSELSGTTNGDVIFKQNIKNNSLASNWVHYKLTIDDQAIISAITNNKITVVLKTENTCGNICILLDNINYEKSCTKLENNKLYVTKNPGFDLKRISDNKKSWVDTTEENRNFSITNVFNANPFRATNYDVNDDRLIINTKEIDLDINLASAIEYDVWYFSKNNPGILSGTGTTTNCCYSACCGDNKINFNSLLSKPVSATTTIYEFEDLLGSELIDVKNRKTISSYPTLRALYDRYMKSYQYVQTNSLAFDYANMDKFSHLIGDYWSDIIEQVVPATTIWGSVKIYSNTMFDQQKFNYKSYSSLLCNNPFSGETVVSPINGKNGQYTGVTVSMINLSQGSEKSLRLKPVVSTDCNALYIAQMNHGSEFIGKVTIVGSQSNLGSNNTNSVVTCNIYLKVSVIGSTATADVSDYVAPLTYNWSNGGGNSPTATYSTPGTYSLTVTDANNCTATQSFIIV